MSATMDIQGVVLRWYRATANSIPVTQHLATPVEILAGGALSVPIEELVWGDAAGAHVFSYEQAERIARLVWTDMAHAYAGTVSREEAHPSAHVVRQPGRPAALAGRVVEDWHAGKPNCGVD